MYRLTLSGAALAFLLASMPVLAADSYRCVVADTRGAGNWIAPEILVTHDPETGKVTVKDAMTEAFPSSNNHFAKVIANNNRRLTFGWNVGVSNATQGANMKYRLTIQKDDLSARVTAIPEGYSNTFQSAAQCARR